MKDALITIINGELVRFKDKEGNYTKEMTKINYTINMGNTDYTFGPSLLVCYKQGNLKEKIKGYCMRSVKAQIEERPTDNGSKYVIVKIGDIEL